MIKNSKTKKILAGILSTAMLASAIPSFGITSGVSAAGNANYAEALEISLYFYDANQCGCEVDDNCLTWRGNCHTYDAEASLDKATKLSSSAKSVIQSQNGGSNKVDLSGGYHDAGDHVKFNITMAFNASSLGWAYYAYPEAFKDTGTEGHLFYVLRETADYLMKSTFLNNNGEVAAICHTVADGNVDHGIWTAPETQTYERATYWLTSEANNNRIAYQMAAALASVAATFKNSDPTYAAECLKYADAIYNFSKKYNGNEMSGMSFYGTDPANVPGDKAWAEAWLYLADSSKHSLPTDKPTGNGNYNGNYDGWIYSWGKVWGGYACLMAQITGDSAYLNEVKYNSDKFSNNNAKQYYVIDGWGNSRYNCAWQAYALTYGELANNQSYLDAAAWQMDFILGNNPAGYSYLLGYSNKYPTRIHHRAANPDKQAMKYTLYGALVGGASDTSGSITDAVDSYAQTEMALDYNACFTVACAGLYSAFGGDTTTAQAIIDAAPEIKSDFDFGDATVTPDPVECKVTVSVGDEKTGEYIPGAEVLMETEAEAIVWNTSDENPKTIVACTSIDENVSYQALIRNIPDGYIEAAGNNYYVKFSEDSTTAEIVIKLQKIEETTPEPTTKPDDNIVWGDANCDGQVLVNDVVLVMSYALNPVNAGVTPEGIRNADVYQTGDGLAVTDAASIQKFLTKIINSLPES